MSYLTYVKIWLIGDHWDIKNMRTIATDNMAAITQQIMEIPTCLLNSTNRSLENAHLASFVRAVKLANKHDWHARLWKELYDIGSTIAPKLQMSNVFKYYVEGKQDGADFARAIGIMDI
jgi:hypothetical protein